MVGSTKDFGVSKMKKQPKPRNHSTNHVMTHVEWKAHENLEAVHDRDHAML
jgi:hypothetical protein